MPSLKIEKIELSFKDAAGGGPSIQTSKIGEIVRRMGLAPSEAEIERFAAGVGSTCDLQSFTKFCESIVHPEDTYENLVQFFKSYDSKNTGSITNQQLTSLLTNTGEVLSEKEIEVLLNPILPGDRKPPEVGRRCHSGLSEAEEADLRGLSQSMNRRRPSETKSN
ncbi:hypothetical protein OJ253_1988 [Cryptosporidium canis]|uniref:Calmodulin n=1 Tax=Cryptosporidium canis TaxID=195482 RepID=A0A9D5DGH7_9CRYT|nr:hypothetical protein OJ253_1988 [Cryptosporidium canis]